MLFKDQNLSVFCEGAYQTEVIPGTSQSDGESNCRRYFRQVQILRLCLLTQLKSAVTTLAVGALQIKMVKISVKIIRLVAMFEINNLT